MGRSFYITLGLLLTFSTFLWIFYPPPLLPIKIGLMVSFTGSSPHLGREIRDGAFLAVEEINKSGGINRRKLELIIKDNRGNSEIAKMNYLEFLNEGVIAVIGPATSTIARALLPLIDEKKLLALSPTVSGNEFSNRDDYLIRLEPSNKDFGEALGSYIKNKIKPNRILIMVDERNPVYTADFANSFITQIDKNSSIHMFTIKEKISDFNVLVKEALMYKPDLILMVTDIFNASIINQKIRIINPHIKLVIAPWARFSGFISFTGYLAEGVLSVGYYDESPTNENYMKFREKFMQKFGYPPDSSVINGYNTVMIIKEAILKGEELNSIREKILNSQFKLPMGEIKINKYGDSELKPFVVVINNGMFEKIER